MKFLGIYLAFAVILANVIMAEDDPFQEESRKLIVRQTKDLKSGVVTTLKAFRKTVKIDVDAVPCLVCRKYVFN